jgi:hypothetical protein
MDTKQILTEVKAEISRLQKVVDLLEGGTSTSPIRASSTGGGMSGGGKRKVHQWTEAERKAMSLKQKARWAKQKSGAEPDKPKRPISVASRRKMAAAQKARWAKVKSQKKTA